MSSCLLGSSQLALKNNNNNNNNVEFQALLNTHAEIHLCLCVRV